MTAIDALREAQATLTAAIDRRSATAIRKLTTGYASDHDAHRAACIAVHKAQDAYDRAREDWLVDRALREDYR